MSARPSGIRDLQVVTESDQTLIQRLVTLAVLAVLIVILRRPLVSLYLIASVLFSYYVTIGHHRAVVRLVVWPHLPRARLESADLSVRDPGGGGRRLQHLPGHARLRRATAAGPLRGPARRRWSRTGGIITSCGVIMAGTFISMMTGTLRGMLELGFCPVVGRHARYVHRAPDAGAGVPGNLGKGADDVERRCAGGNGECSFEWLWVLSCARHARYALRPQHPSGYLPRRPLEHRSNTLPRSRRCGRSRSLRLPTFRSGKIICNQRS